MKGSNTQKPDLEMGIKGMGCPKPNLDGTGDHYSLSKMNILLEFEFYMLTEHIE